MVRPGAVEWWIGDDALIWHLRLVGTIPRGTEALDCAGSWTPRCNLCSSPPSTWCRVQFFLLLLLAIFTANWSSHNKIPLLWQYPHAVQSKYVPFDQLTTIIQCDFQRHWPRNSSAVMVCQWTNVNHAHGIVLCRSAIFTVTTLQTMWNSLTVRGTP